MNSIDLFICLLLLCLLCACCLQKEASIVCNKPYIRVAGDCCLDLNDNNICDSDEVTTTTTTTTTTSTTTSTSSTSTTASTVSTTSTTTSTIPHLSGGPKYINGFRAYEDKNNFVAYFYFTNESGDELKVFGTAYLNLSDGERILYSGKINISKENYLNTTIGFGNVMHILCIIRVPLYDVGVSRLATGRADIVFTLPDGSYFSADYREVTFPRATDEDLNHYQGSEYMKSSTPLDIVEKRSNVAVTLVRAGYYYIYESDESNGTRYLRVDLEIRNLGLDKISFSSQGALVNVNSSKYGLDSDSTVAVRDLYPGSVGGGYLLFDGVPDLGGRTFDVIVGSSTDVSGHETEFFFQDVLIA